VLHLAQLGAENFRRFDTLSLRPHRRLNFLYGDNASGKTSLLETVYCLGRGRSFRGSSLQDCTGPVGRGWRLRGHYQRDSLPTQTVDAQWRSGEGLRQLHEGVETTRVELIRGYPVQILEPGLHKLLQDGPSYRRSFLDWGVFHVEQSFHDTWRRYSRALRQRNLALRARAPAAEVDPWSRELASAGEQLQTLRRRVLERTLPGFGVLVQRLLDTDAWSLELSPGWPEGASLLASLRERLERDRQAGLTQDGPHRAELRLRLHSRQARSLISRGQQKQLIAALLISQCELIASETGSPPILLVDDFASELGEDYQQRLWSVLGEYAGQVFVTGFEVPASLSRPDESALFHVEQGRVRRV